MPVALTFLPHGKVESTVTKGTPPYDVVALLSADKDTATPVSLLPGARKVAWKYPSGEPVWAAVLSKAPTADSLITFLGGPTGHRLWSESEAGFTITSGKTHAEAFAWVVEHPVNPGDRRPGPVGRDSKGDQRGAVSSLQTVSTAAASLHPRKAAGSPFRLA